MDGRMMYLHAFSPVHTGTGQAVDVIDLPVAREITTNWPYIPGSSIKGVLRSLCKPDADAGRAERASFEEAFGPDTDRASEGAGSLLFGDGRLLCLPVRSLFGTFAWVSCPLALDRYRRDHDGIGLDVVPALEARITDEQIAVSGAASLIAHDGMVYLEDLDLAVASGVTVLPLGQHIADAVFDDATWRDHFTARFAVVGDTTFTFLTETATEVSARVRLNEETKTVAAKALWYEEAIPAETIFSTPLLAAPRGGRPSNPLFQLVDSHLDGLIQIGGNATVGRGLMRARLAEAQP